MSLRILLLTWLVASVACASASRPGDAGAAGDGAADASTDGPANDGVVDQGPDAAEDAGRDADPGPDAFPDLGDDAGDPGADAGTDAGDPGGDAGTDAGGDMSAGCAEESESCASGQACCEGLRCCSGIPVPPGEEFCGVTCPMSDRNRKEAFTSVDADAVLAGVASLPITRWRYRDDAEGAPHIGPMAQDFQATFGVGSDARFIAPVDGDGVALVAIQALERRLRSLEAQNAAQEDELAALRRRLAVCGD